MAIIERPSSNEYPAYAQCYMDLVPAGDVLAMLFDQAEETAFTLGQLSDDEASVPYAPGKWTAKDIVGHLIDTERILTYRALRFSRNDQTPLPGFDQDGFVSQANFNRRTLRELIDELMLVRKTSVALFRGMSDEMLARGGVANNARLTVRSIPYFLVGHQAHHVSTLKARYLATRVLADPAE